MAESEKSVRPGTGRRLVDLHVFDVCDILGALFTSSAPTATIGE